MKERPTKDFGFAMGRIVENGIEFLTPLDREEGIAINQPQYIWIQKATQLRDWLNEVFPKETPPHA